MVELRRNTASMLEPRAILFDLVTMRFRPRAYCRDNAYEMYFSVVRPMLLQPLMFPRATWNTLQSSAYHHAGVPLPPGYSQSGAASSARPFQASGRHDR